MTFVVEVNENAVKAGSITNIAYVQIGDNVISTGTNGGGVTNTVVEFFELDEEIVPDEGDEDSWVKNETVSQYEDIEFEISTTIPILTVEDLNDGGYYMLFHSELDPELVLHEDDFKIKVAGEWITDDSYYSIITEDTDDDCDFHVVLYLSALYNNGVITDDDLGNGSIQIFFYADLENAESNKAYASTVYYQIFEENSDKAVYTSDQDEVVVYISEAPVKSVDVGDGTDVYVGDELTYTIAYDNYSSEEAVITVTDDLDDGLTYVAGSAGSSSSSGASGTIVGGPAAVEEVEGGAGGSDDLAIWDLLPMPQTGQSRAMMFGASALLVSAIALITLFWFKRKQEG